MVGLLFVFVLVLLVGLLVVSTVISRLKMFAIPVEEAVRMPANMGWILLIAIAALNVFAYNVGFGIGYGVLGALIIGGILFSFPAEKRTVDAWFLTITGIVAYLLFGFRANEFVQTVNVVAALMCTGALILLRSVDTVRWNGLWITKMKLGFIARLLHRPFGIGTRTAAPSAASRRLLTVIKTVTLTAVVLFFFSAILSSADPIFESIVREVQEQAFGRTVLSGILVAALLLALMIKIPTTWQKDVPQMRLLGFTELFIPTLSLVLLFGLFLGIQAKYLFASHEVFQALNITYSDYVHRGFIELMVASFFGSMISYVLILKQQTIRQTEDALKLKWVNGVLLLELLLLLLSAAKRDWMYMEVYGLTRVRVIGVIFLLWLFGLIALIIALNFLRCMNEQWLIRGTAILSAIVVLILNGFNIDHRVAFSSLFHTNEPSDIVYMSRLSSDAISPWMMAITEASMRYESLRTKKSFTEEEKQSLADSKIAMAILDKKLEKLLQPRKWQEWNLSEQRAREALSQSGMQSLPSCIRNGIYSIQRATNTDLVDLESRRLNDYYSPFIFDDVYVYPESLNSLAFPTGAIALGETPPSCGKLLESPLTAQ